MVAEDQTRPRDLRVSSAVPLILRVKRSACLEQRRYDGPSNMAGNLVVNALVASLCLFSGASAWPASKRQTLSIDDIQKQALANAQKVLEGTLDDGLKRGEGCTKATVATRKE